MRVEFQTQGAVDRGLRVPPGEPAADFGGLLRALRRARRLSQARLAARAGVSTRHVCFLEGGRAAPSRAMVLRLADALAVTPPERSRLLLAASFAPGDGAGGWLGPGQASALLEAVLDIRACVAAHDAADAAARWLERLGLAPSDAAGAPGGEGRPWTDPACDPAEILARRLIIEAAASRTRGDCPREGPFTAQRAGSGAAVTASL